MKNRNIPYYVAALMLAAGVSTSFVSCVDTDEPSSIEKLREAKANEVNAQAAYKNALAQKELQTAEIEKQKAAQAAIDTQIKDLEKQVVESNLTVTKAKNELAVLKQQNGKVEENARAAIQAVKDGKDLNAEQIKAINVAIKYEAEVAAKEDSIKYLKDKYAAELASSAANLQKTIAETKEALTKLEMHTANREAELTDSVLVVKAETDEVAKNVLTAKENAEGLLTATFDAWIQAKFNVIKAQANLAEEQYKASVYTVKDTIAMSLDAATDKAAGGVETQKLAVAAAEDNLSKLQALKDKTDYQSWLKAYNDADNYIKVDIENKQTARKTTLADKKIQKTAADNAVAKAEDAYKDYTKPFQKKLDDYEAKSAFYKYDISAADYATLLSYITDIDNVWKGKLGSAAYTITQVNKDKSDKTKNFLYDEPSKQFVSTKQEITNADFENAIGELCAVANQEYDKQEKYSGVIGQFIEKTKSDNTSKKDAETTLKTYEKTLFKAENVKSDFVPTDDRATVYTYFDAKKKYTDAFENLRTAKKNYNSAVATVESTKKAQENAQKALDENTDATKTAALQLALDNAKNAYNNAVQNLNNDEKDKIGVKALLIGSTYDADKYPGAIPTYNKCVTEFQNACKALFGDNYAAKANKFAKTLVTETDLDDTKHNGLALNEEVKRNEEDATGFKPSDITTNKIDNAPRFVFDLPDRLKAEDLSVILDGKTLTDYQAAIYDNNEFGIAESEYVKYLRQKNVVVPEWTNKIKADEEAAKFVTTVKSHVNVADAAITELSIIETLKQLNKDRGTLQTAVYEARYTEEGKKLLAEVESKKATQSAAADSVAKYDEYDKVTNPKGLVDQAIKEEKAAKEELQTLYKGLIEAAFKKAAGDNTYTYDAEKYAETYAKAEIKLEKALADAKADLAVAEAKLAAAKKGEVYTPAEVKAPIVTVKKEFNETSKKYEYKVDSNDQTITNTNKTYESYIDALKAAVTETQANVNDLNTQYESAKKLYEEAMAQVAAYIKAKAE